MNKKQKILTIVALAIFSALILFHYVGWTIVKYDWPYEKVEEILDQNIEFMREHGYKVTVLKDLGLRTNEFRQQSHWYEANVKWLGRGFHVDDKPAIKDVRMPIFVLAVFYAGFFFILATPLGPKS